ncbi:MAG: 4-hydroxy-tetrahydrodipicolinate reductase [Bacteroidota bacterium]
MANIALLGYGKMGKAVEQEALQRGHQIVARIDQDTPQEWSKLVSGKVEVVIEFTHPESFQGNFEKVMGLGIPMVTGTTGWYDRRKKFEESVGEVQGAFLYASNFSIGVNILFLLNQRLAQLMNGQPQYDCFLEEQHHKFKADAPSGTAYSLGSQVLENLDRKTRFSDASLRSRAPAPEELSIGFTRAGGIIGKHVVSYTSEIDTVSITHEAHNRRGFALGAVIGAEWVLDKQGFFEFSTIFDQLG